MVHPRLAKPAERLLRHSRAIHTSTQTTPASYKPSIAHLLDKGPADPENVVVNGFIRSIRNQKQRSFASVGDGSSLEPLQALLTPEQAQSLSTGAAVCLTGSWRPSPNANAQKNELHVHGVNVIGASDPATFPLQKKYHTPEYLRTMPHIRSRSPINTTMLRFRSEAIAAVSKMFMEQGFIQTHTPIITSSDCEGAGEAFSVASSHKGPTSTQDDGSFFKSPRYLTVSSQLHLEALAQSVGKVWTLSPTFRAEKSDTARHLSEFYMLEAEMTFTESMQDVMDVVKSTIQAITTNMVPGLSRVSDELGTIDQKEFERRIMGTWDDWPSVTYSDAIKLLQNSNHTFQHEPRWGTGLQAEHERYLASEIGATEQKLRPVFVTHYPKSIKPFYMLSSSTNNGSQDTVDCFDLLVPETCEIVGGSMREHRLEFLLKSMQEHKLIPSESSSATQDLGNLGWYVDLRRWGSVPHGGFGLGFDRLLGYLAGVPNIREVVTFPRWVGRCEC